MDPTITTLAGFGTGAAAALSMIFAMVALQVLEAWRFSTVRGPLGALASVGRSWLHARRDADSVDGTVAAIGAVAIPCGAAAMAAVGGAAALPVVLSILLGAAGVPIVAALAGGRGSEARLALDDALRRATRHALLVGAVLVTPSAWSIAVGSAALLAMMRQRHEAPPGFQPRYDVALGAGTRMALDAGERGTALVCAWVVAVSVSAAWPETWVGHGVPAAVTALSLVTSLLAAVLIAAWGGPQRTAVRGLAGPLVLLAVAVVLRLGAPFVGLAADAVAADAAGP